jgi:hypothetical protein
MAVGLAPVPGESAGSFVRRLAAVNAASVAQVLQEAGAGRGAVELDPCTQEVVFTDQGVQRLAVMAWRTPEDLHRALPTLAVRAGRRPVRVVPWPAGWTRLEPCAGCLACRDDAVTPVWLASGEPWQVCVRHGRWLHGGESVPFQVGLAGLEQVVQAHRRRVRLQQRIGRYARALLADALQVTACWWQSRQMGSETVWAQRERVLGAGRQWWSVPLVVYPEAVVVAEAMAVYDRQRRFGRDFDTAAPGWISRN